MKKILYMAMSLDGYISDRNGKTPWSDEEWEKYKSKVIEIGNIAIGYNTYIEMLDSKIFYKIGNPNVFVFTSKKIENYGAYAFINNYSDFEFETTRLSCKEVLIAGGTKLNSFFLKNNLIDEIFLDIEPFIFGGGLKLFEDVLGNRKLELLNSEKYGKNGIQLHYKFNS